MSKASDANLKGIPMKPYDLLREGLIVFAIIAAIIIVLAILLGSPDYPTVTPQEIAKKAPVSYLKLVTDYFSGDSDMQTYGFPYTKNPENSQSFLGLAPQNITGTAIPIDAQKDFVMKPLESIAQVNPEVKKALEQFNSATDGNRAAWIKNYTAALDKAQVDGDSVKLPVGDYGPVPVLMDGMLNLARAGLMTGALNDNSMSPYVLDNTKSILFVQGDVLDNIAGKLDMQGGQWGISHETGNYPGAWWLWAYAFFYQVPAIGNSPNADILVGVIMTGLFLLLLFLPLIPGLNRIPYRLKVYRIIWRDWYKEHKEIK